MIESLLVKDVTIWEAGETTYDRFGVPMQSAPVTVKGNVVYEEKMVRGQGGEEFLSTMQVLLKDKYPLNSFFYDGASVSATPEDTARKAVIIRGQKMLFETEPEGWWYML